MPIIDISTKIRKPPDIVYKILKDVEQFPQFMRDAKQVKIIKRRSDNIFIAEWKADIDGTPIEWKEEDAFNDIKKNVTFRMIEGSFKKYEGSWTLSNAVGGTTIRLHAYLEWGVPNIERYVGPILKKKAFRSIRSMVWLIRKRANQTNNG